MRTSRRSANPILVPVLIAVALTTVWAAPAVAQSAAARGAQGDSVIVYRREVFRYSRAGRPDPFRSLVAASEVGNRLEDFALRGVVYHSDPSRSVAVLARAGTARPVRARVGDRIGGIRIVTIRPQSIDVLVEELGVARRTTLQITRTPAKGKES